jgi:hypothetical protein
MTDLELSDVGGLNASCSHFIGCPRFTGLHRFEPSHRLMAQLGRHLLFSERHVLGRVTHHSVDFSDKSLAGMFRFMMDALRLSKSLMNITGECTMNVIAQSVPLQL